jgi:hypothetical protein
MPELNIERRIASGDTAYGSLYLLNNFPTDSSYINSSSFIQNVQQERKPRLWVTSAKVGQEKHGIHEIDYFVYKDSFTQDELLNSEENQIDELIFQIRKTISIHHHDRLANKLLVLFKAAKEDDPASLGIAVGSLRNFYNFFRANINLKCPVISLTPDYNIYASWRGEKKQVFSVHFLPNGDVRFVIFKSNDRHPERMIRLSGIATTDILMKTVAPYGVAQWITE